MKRVLKVVGFFLVVILLTGCMNVQTKIEIKSDKSVDISLSMEINLFEMMNSMTSDGMYGLIKEQFKNQLCSSLCPYEEGTQEYTNCIDSCQNTDNTEKTEMPTESEIKNYLDEYFESDDFNISDFLGEETKGKIESLGYKVETNVDKEKYLITINIFGHFANIDDISSDNNIKTNIRDIFQGESDNKFFIKTNNTYKANISSYENSEMPVENIDINKYIKYSYEVILPNKTISNNASKVSDDGKTLIWNLKANDKNNVEYEFAFSEPKKTIATASTNIFTNFFKDMNNEKIIALSLIAGGSLTVVIATIVFVVSNKKNK